MECAYALTPARAWLSGFLTLLSSVERASGPHDHCGYVFVWSPLVPDSVLTPQEKRVVKHIAGQKPVLYHQVDSERLQLWSSVPHLRKGVLLAWMKLELFFDWHDECQPRQVIYLDTDMYVLKSLSFVHRVLAKEEEDAAKSVGSKWTLHGSANWFGFSGWVIQSDMTPTHPPFINTGFLAFRRPAPKAFLDGLRRRVDERISNDVKVYLADQDVINHVVGNGRAPPGVSLHVHRNWYANYRPNNNVSLHSWRVAHWMGVEKPWGKRGHTNAPVRYNDAVLPHLDMMWLSECRALLVSLSAANLDMSNVTISCGDGVTRNVPGRVDESAYYLAGTALVLVLVVRHTFAGCKEACGARWAWAAVCFVAVLWGMLCYLDADWDHAGWIREPLGLSDFEFANGRR